MTLVPARFLVRISHPCLYVKAIPRQKGDELLDLPEDCRIDNFAALDETRNFADVRMAWNEFGIAMQVEVRGKDQPLQGSAERSRSSDGVALWIDTRDARTSHRASRFCHQFHLLPTGGGDDGDEPVLLQTKIHRALQDAPLCNTNEVPFRSRHIRSGYVVEVFLPSAALNGFDPEQNTKLGFYYAVRDNELGEQVLSVSSAFPYYEDPSLWSVLELMK